MTTYPFIPTPQGPCIVLTNGCCENTDHWTPDAFEQRGLAYQQETPWGPYPLTQEEARYLGEDGFETHYGFLYMGYSILWQDQKWACPIIEYVFDVPTEHSTPKQPSQAFIQRVQREERLWQKILAPLDGHVIEDFEGADDRLCLMLAVPFSSLQERFPDVDGWKQFLKNELMYAGRP